MTKVCEVRYSRGGEHAFYVRDQDAAIARVGTDGIARQTYTFHDVEIDAVFLVVRDENDYGSCPSILSIHKTHEGAEIAMATAAAEDKAMRAYSTSEWEVEIRELKP
jgi:hypothetical protein